MQLYYFLNIGFEFRIQERIALERFVQAGGGFDAIHPTAKTFNWRWYGRMIGSTAIQAFHLCTRNMTGRVTYKNETLDAQNITDERF
jgi:hypothetical protein